MGYVNPKDPRSKPGKYTRRVNRYFKKRRVPITTRLETKVKSLSTRVARSSNYHYYYNTISNNIDNVPTFHMLTGNVLKGVNVTQRIGDDVGFNSLVIDGTLELQQNNITTSATINNMRIRTMVIQWMDDLTTTPLSADIFQDTTYEWNSPLVLDKKARKRFRVLYDRMTIFNGSQFSGGSIGAGQWVMDPAKSCVRLRIVIGGKRMKKVEYDPSTSTYGKGHIYFLTISDASPATYPIGQVRAGYVLRWNE